MNSLENVFLSEKYQEIKDEINKHEINLDHIKTLYIEGMADFLCRQFGIVKLDVDDDLDFGGDIDDDALDFGGDVDDDASDIKYVSEFTLKDRRFTLAHKRFSKVNLKTN